MKRFGIFLPLLVLTLAAFGASFAGSQTATADKAAPAVEAKSMDGCESCCCCKDSCDKAAHDKAMAGHDAKKGEKGEKGCC